MKNYNDFEKIHSNLYKLENTYYRLYASGVSPNGCWLTSPSMVELIDIDIATGKDVIGSHVVSFDVCGTVNANNEFVVLN